LCPYPERSTNATEGVTLFPKSSRYPAAAGTAELALLRAWAEIETISMNAEQVRLAREAYSRFGKGRHPAALPGLRHRTSGFRKGRAILGPRSDAPKPEVD
jgi:hypothetical protein